MTNQTNPLSIRTILLFFVPLAASAVLVTLSHVIINSTLARAPQAETVIAAYAIAMSVFAVTERPVILLRQTCSALARDRFTFLNMAKVTTYSIITLMIISLAVAYTPVGKIIFQHFFGADPALVAPILDVYRILMYVMIFSAIRCLFHGIIISNLRTKWLTIGMVVRLVVMYVLSLYFIYIAKTIDARSGAIIFLVGMFVEALVSFLEGRSLLKTLPVELPEKKRTTGQIFKFYRPLIYSSFIAVIVGPSINAMLGRTVQFELAIASYAIALSVTQLVLSFVSYMHQVVLNFYQMDRKKVYQFAIPASFVPAILVTLIAYTPIGMWLLQNVIGVKQDLLSESIGALKVFAIMAFAFPWVDFLNGRIILQGETRIMVWSQVSNVGFTLTALFLCIWWAPHWNGKIGALAQSLGVTGEMLTSFIILKMLAATKGRVAQSETEQTMSAD